MKKKPKTGILQRFFKIICLAVTLREQYPDVQGWLTIPDTGIDYPVLQSE